MVKQLKKDNLTKVTLLSTTKVNRFLNYKKKAKLKKK
jgi:hypothetical protein